MTVDCVKLMNHLQDDYIDGLRVEMIPAYDRAGQAYIRVEVCDYATIAEGQQPHRSLWATRSFYSEIYLISHDQLFELLISAHKVIEKFFSTGVDNRPSSLKD